MRSTGAEYILQYFSFAQVCPKYLHVLYVFTDDTEESEGIVRMQNEYLSHI